MKLVPGWGGLLVRVFARLEVDLINNGSFTMWGDKYKSWNTNQVLVLGNKLNVKLLQ